MMSKDKKTVFRKHLRKQIYHMIKETIEWIFAVWLLGGGIVVAFLMGFGATMYSKIILGIEGSDLGMLYLGIGVVIWIGSWVIILIAFTLDEIRLKIKKNLEIVRENAEEEVASLEKSQCPECKSKFDPDSQFCANCGVKTHGI